jgi:3-deoxy-D-manno-octulosonic-acid transferase
MIERIVRQLYSLVARPLACGLSWSMRRKGIWSDESIAQRYSRQLPASKGAGPVWIHAASMGEVRVGATVAQELAAHGAVILGTAMTETGYNLMRKIYPEGSICTRAPFDLRAPLIEFLNRYAPSALILVETEWWPNMLACAHTRGVPAFVVNGRISDRAFPRYRWTSWFWRPVLSRVDRFYMRSQIDADRLLALGADSSRITVSGSLKVATAPAISQSTRDLVESLVKHDAPIWIAGSTRPAKKKS